MPGDFDGGCFGSTTDFSKNTMSKIENTAMSTVMGKEWAEEQRQRALRMDRLYVLDGRHRPDHEFHGLYNLYQCDLEPLVFWKLAKIYTNGYKSQLV